MGANVMASNLSHYDEPAPVLVACPLVDAVVRAIAPVDTGWMMDADEIAERKWPAAVGRVGSGY